MKNSKIFIGGVLLLVCIMAVVTMILFASHQTREESVSADGDYAPASSAPQLDLLGLSFLIPNTLASLLPGAEDESVEESLSGVEENPPQRYTDKVEEIFQNPTLPAGCESVALTAILRSMGFELSLTEIVDDYLVIDPWEGDFVYRFFGSPYVAGGAFPPAMVDAANAYLIAQGSELRARDITGSEFSELAALTEEGVPVLVWTTVDLLDPDFTGMVIDGYEWYSNEHCVVLYGIEGGEVLVSDPLSGLVRRDIDEFSRIYEACGSMAAIISE